jgi:hypothetical protein
MPIYAHNLQSMEKKMSAENRFSEDRDMSSAADYALSERRISGQTIISAKAKSKSRLCDLSRGTLKDELTYQLSSAARMDLKTFETIDKYHERAKSVLYRINVYDLSAIDIATVKSKGIFVINTSDISPSLYHELETLKESDPSGFDGLVTEAVQTILEGINKRYYHIASLPYKVTWRFED